MLTIRCLATYSSSQRKSHDDQKAYRFYRRRRSGNFSRPDRNRADPAPAPRRPRARGGRKTRRAVHAHRQRRHLQPVHFPRPDADRREARVPGRLRLRAQERLLPRHLGFEHQLAARFRRLQSRLQPRVGYVRRLEVRVQRGLGHRHRRPLLLLPGQLQPRLHHANTTEFYIAGSWKWVSLKYSYSVDHTFGVPDTNAWYLDSDRELSDQRSVDAQSPTSVARSTTATPTASTTASSTTPTGSWA